mgnify:CR=1 FL=1
MSLEAHTSDTAIPFTVTPSFDVENAYILAFVYNFETKKYAGRVNAVNPYQEFPKLEFTIENAQAGDQINLDILLQGYVDGELKDLTTVNFTDITDGSTSQVLKKEFDPKNFTNISIKNIIADDQQNDYFFQNDEFEIINPVFSTETGTVVAGPVGQSFPFFCDFTKIPAGIYSIVWVATPDSNTSDGFQGSGIIGKDILILKSNDGFKV